MKIGPEQLLKLQAYVDGELSPDEARRVEELLASDVEAQRVVDELRLQKRLIQATELFDGRDLPVPFEVYWCGIKRRIESGQLVVWDPRGRLGIVLLAERLLRALTPVLVAGACFVIAVWIYKEISGWVHADRTYHIVASMRDPGVITYRDWNQRITVVWFPYPAEGK